MDDEKNKYSLTIKENIVNLTGHIDDLHPQLYLDPFFEKVLSISAEEIVIDLRNLKFINSSGIKSFVNFLIKRKSTSKIVILSSLHERWQIDCLDLLQNLDTERIIVKKF